MTAAVQASPRENGTCAQCERVWLLEDLGRDGNGDMQCTDCASTDTSGDDATSCRDYLYAGR